MPLSIPAAAMLLKHFRRSRLDAQRLLHLIPASDPASLTTARLIVWDLDAIISHLERRLDTAADA